MGRFTIIFQQPPKYFEIFKWGLDYASQSGNSSREDTCSAGARVYKPEIVSTPRVTSEEIRKPGDKI